MNGAAQAPRSAAGSRRRKIALALTAALGPLLACELVLRALGSSYPPFELPLIVWDQTEDQRFASENALHRVDRRTLWSPKPGAPLPWSPNEQISPAGFRREDPDADARWRALTLGDSSTFGHSVREEQTYSFQLERRVAQRRQARAQAAPAAQRACQVLDGGVIGFSLLQGVERYRGLRETWAPQVVVAAFGAVNEHFPTFDLNDREKLELFARKDSAWEKLRVGLRANLRVLQLADWIREELRGGRQAILQAIALREQEKRRSLRNYLQSADYPRRVSLADYAVGLRELARLVRSDGGTLVCMRMPRSAAMEQRWPPALEYDAVLREFAIEERLPFVDGQLEFQRLLEAGMGEAELFVDTVHPTPFGHAALARLLFEELERSSLLPP